MKRVYTTSSTSSGDGRSGHVRSADGVLDLDLSVPKEIGGAGGTGTNPEELFSAGYSACFHSALLGSARMEKVKMESSTVEVEIGLNDDDGAFALSANIKVNIAGIDQQTAQKLADKAHEMCPYSRATRNNIAQSVEVAVS